jgi:riboflavin biosynthesis pyrimidine reductase
MIAASTSLEQSVADAWRIEPLGDAAQPRPRPVRGGTLPPPLARRYGSDLTIGLRSAGPTVVANFVTTLDGVVAFDTMGQTGGREVSGGFTPDRFLMGLLRATADAVLVGAGTVRSGARHVWTPDHVHPPSSAAFATWRAQLGLAASQPTTVVVTASGRIDPEHPGLRRPDVPVLVVTTSAGSRHLGSIALPPTVEVMAVDDREGQIDVHALRSVLGVRHFDLVVCEGGPTLFGGLIGAGLVDELFLTVAPQIAGRAAGLPRLALVEGLGYEAGSAPWATLNSVMRAGNHLFLRYGLAGAAIPLEVRTGSASPADIVAAQVEPATVRRVSRRSDGLPFSLRTPIAAASAARPRPAPRRSPPARPPY